jgi:hypothetical protein
MLYHMLFAEECPRDVEQGSARVNDTSHVDVKRGPKEKGLTAQNRKSLISLVGAKGFEPSTL